MNRKRFTAAVVVAFIIATVLDIFINGLIMKGAFEESTKYWRPTEELTRLIPLGWGSMGLMMALLGLLFIRTEWRGIRRGLEFGFWLGLAAVVGVVGMISLVPWPITMISSMAIQQFANSLVLGFTFGWLYKDKALLAQETFPA